MEEEKEVKEMKKRMRGDRFKDHLSHLPDHIERESESHGPQGVLSPKRFKGVSTKLEKSYFRLTSAPQPLSVRPINILKLALENVKLKYMENEDYSYACEQLKSIRQDLTVQNIHNRFAAHVYETHGRIALESGDLEEYNQCQSRLQEMKRRGIQVSADEFNCYQLLHCLYRGNKLEMIGVLRRLSKDDQLGNEFIAFVLKVRECLLAGNYSKFFKLYRLAPHMSGYLLDYMLHSVRNSAYDSYLRSYDTLFIPDIVTLLNFGTERECIEYLQKKNAVFIWHETNEQTQIDCRASRTRSRNSIG